MPRIEIYTRAPCPYCTLAMRLLEARGLAYEHIDLRREPERTEEMLRRAGGRRTVPEIFIGGELVGGYEELLALDRQGGLVALAQEAQGPAGGSGKQKE